MCNMLPVNGVNDAWKTFPELSGMRKYAGICHRCLDAMNNNLLNSPLVMYTSGELCILKGEGWVRTMDKISSGFGAKPFCQT